MKDLDGLIEKVLALNSAKFYLRKQVTLGRRVTGDLIKSADLATFWKKSEKSHNSQHPFEIQLQIEVENCMIWLKSYMVM